MDGSWHRKEAGPQMGSGVTLEERGYLVYDEERTQTRYATCRALRYGVGDSYCPSLSLLLFRSLDIAVYRRQR